MGFQDRDYSKDNSSPPNYLNIPQLNAIWWLIIICSIFSLIDLDQNLRSMSDVSYDAVINHFHFWAVIFSPVTPSFFSGWLSLVLVIYFFGNRLVDLYGFKEFITLYFFWAFLGIVTYWLFRAFASTQEPISLEPWDWSMLGILMINTLLSPNENVRLYFILPIKLKFLFSFYVLIKFAFMVNYDAPIVEYVSLVMVLAFTFIYSHYRLRLTDLLVTLRRAKMKVIPGGLNKKPKIAEMSDIEIKKEVDRILDKITEKGPGSLSSGERDFLKQSSLKFKK